MMRVMSDIEAKPMRLVDGAGVRPEVICRPSKRVRNWHRHAVRGHELGREPNPGSLKMFAIEMYENGRAIGMVSQRALRSWLTTKGIMPDVK